MNNANEIEKPRLDKTLYNIFIVIARLGLAYLFFTQLWWKLPPNFGCGSAFNFPQPSEQNFWTDNNSSGLCYWMGLESVFASKPRPVLIADMRSAGLPTISIDIAPVARLNGLLLDNVFIPNIRIFGWLVWLAEFWIFLSMFLGLFSRLGSLTAIGMTLQLFIGLANIPRPFEWEWSYGTAIFLAFTMLATAPGRVLGVDAWLRMQLLKPGSRSNLLKRIGLLLT